MYFLLNETIIEVNLPEIHLQQRWRALGCGDPKKLAADEAVFFVKDRLSALIQDGQTIDKELARDFAALLISLTGANSLVLKPGPGGELEPRLQHLPHLVLQTYWRGADNDYTRSDDIRLKA